MPSPRASCSSDRRRGARCRSCTAGPPRRWPRSGASGRGVPRPSKIGLRARLRGRPTRPRRRSTNSSALPEEIAHALTFTHTHSRRTTLFGIDESTVFGRTRCEELRQSTHASHHVLRVMSSSPPLLSPECPRVPDRQTARVRERGRGRSWTWRCSHQTKCCSGCSRETG